MITWGITALNHDASIAVVKDRQLIFWQRSSDYSGIRADDQLNTDLVRAALTASGGQGPTDIVWYERPWLKKTRQLYAGQYNWAFDLNELPSVYLRRFNLGYARLHYLPHHLSHAAAGFLTSPFESATVVVLDAMGEWESATIWHGQGVKLRRLWSRSYPTSLGLFYSAFTDLIGYKPVAEEHLLQRLSAQGDPRRYHDLVRSYWRADWRLAENLHRGVLSWPEPPITEQDRADIAAAVQSVFELQAQAVMLRARQLSPSENLVYMGGCAMNSQFNHSLASVWPQSWILPYPGDTTSSLGAALYHSRVKSSWPVTHYE